MFDSLRNNSKIIIYIVVAAFVVTGGLMGFGSYMSNSSPSSSGNSYNYIAVVNGTGITPQQYMNVLRNQAPRTSLSQSEVIPFRFNVLNTMIERQLIMEQADKMEIEVDVSDEDVEDTVSEILDNNDMSEEELIEKLEEQNSTLEQFKQDIRDSLQVSNRMQQTIEKSYDQVQVTEEEIKEIYEESGQEKEYNEIKGQLKEQILSEKQNKAFNNWLENIKAEAEISINDSTLNAYYQLQNENYGQAVELFSNIIESNPGPIIYHYLAQAYAGMENQEKVISTYQEALEEYPDNWELNYNFAHYYRELDKKEEALTQLDKAADKAGEDLMAHYRLYLAYLAMEAEGKAEEEMNILSELQEKMQARQEQMQQQLNEESVPEDEQNPDDLDEQVMDDLDDKDGVIDNKGDRDEN